MNPLSAPQYQHFIRTIQPAEIISVECSGNDFSLVNLTGGAFIRVGFSVVSSTFDKFFAGTGAQFDGTFTRVTLENPQSVPVIAEFVCVLGKFRDSRLSFSGNVNVVPVPDQPLQVEPENAPIYDWQAQTLVSGRVLTVQTAPYTVGGQTDSQASGCVHVANIMYAGSAVPLSVSSQVDSAGGITPVQVANYDEFNDEYRPLKAIVTTYDPSTGSDMSLTVAVTETPQNNKILSFSGTNASLYTAGESGFLIANITKFCAISGTTFVKIFNSTNTLKNEFSFPAGGSGNYSINIPCNVALDAGDYISVTGDGIIVGTTL